MTPSIVHIAGLDVAVDGRLRQRCAWCGALIEDVDLRNVGVMVDPAEPDKTPSLPSWPVGALLGFADGATWVIEYSTGDTLPAQSCTHIDPTVTA